MTSQNDSKAQIIASATAATAIAVATSEHAVQSGDVYVDGKHHTPGAKLQLTASQAKRLGDAVKPA